MTNWEKYFGTPESVADMLANSDVRCEINDSFFRSFPGLAAEWKDIGGDYRESYALEWLKGEETE